MVKFKRPLAWCLGATALVVVITGALRSLTEYTALASTPAAPLVANLAQATTDHDRGRIRPITGGLPVAADGALNPELISDQIAYRHCFAVIALSKTPRPDEAAKHEALVERVGLAAPDAARLRSAVTGLRDTLTLADARTRTSGESPLVVSRAHQSALDASISGSLSTLSPEGGVALERFIRERVKRRIVIYGSVPSN